MIEIFKVVNVPGFVAYPYLDDPFDDIDNQDKYLLHNIFPSISYSFSASLLYSGFNYCIRDLTLFQNEHHLYNEYKSHFISQLSAITDSSCIEKKRISASDYASMFYFTVLHKSSLVPCYKNELICFISGIIRTLSYIYWYIVCLVSSIGNYIKCLQDIVCCIERLNVSVQLLEQCLECCIKTYIKSVESSCSLESLELEIKCGIEPCIQEDLEILGASFKFIMDTTVKIEHSVEHLGYVELDASRSRLCLIESDLNRLKSCIGSDICDLRRIWCSLSCNKSPEDILEKLTSIIKSIEETLGSAKDLAREVRFIVESDCATLECIRSRLCKMCPSIQKIVLSLKFSVRIFVFITKDILCVLNSLNYSINCEIPDFGPYLLGIDCNLQYINLVISWIQIDICSHFDNARNTIYPADCVTSYIDYYWSVLDSFIELKPFLKCSIKSINKNVSELQRRFIRENKNGSSLSRATNSNEHNNFTSKQVGYIQDSIWTLMSNMAIVESKFVFSRLYESITMADKMLGLLWWIENCKCFDYFLLENNEGPYRMANITKFKYDDFHKEHYEKAQDIPGNHLCMCSVICHVLYPNIMRCLCYLVDVDFDTLSTMSRRFDKYNRTARYGLYSSKTIVVVVGVFMKITDWMYQKYGSVFGSDGCGSSICFCRCPNDSYYKYFITTIIYISVLVENTFDHQNETTWDSIQSLSSLKAELENVKFDKQIGESSSCDVYSSSVYIKICCNQVSSRLFYPDRKCSFVFNPMKWECILNQNCCYFRAQCPRSNGNQCCCQLQKSTSCCGCPLVTSSCDSESCVCKNVSRATIKFIINYGISKSEDQYCKDWDNIPNIWCLNKINECIGSDGRDCGCRQATKCVKAKIYCKFKWLLHKYHDMFINEFFNVQINGLLNQLKIEEKRKGFVKLIYVSNNQRLIRTTKNNRMYDSTSGISNNKFEGASNNHYSYNDAYRINNSRAHGSLKYIIIKIVLILIIVVMTIFHSKCRSISRQTKVN